MKLLQNKKTIALYILSIILILVFFYSYSTASVNTYPTEGWQISTPEEQGIQSHILSQMLEHIKNKNLHIDSISIVRNGYMVMDAYFWPFLKTRNHSKLWC